MAYREPDPCVNKTPSTPKNWGTGHSNKGKTEYIKQLRINWDFQATATTIKYMFHRPSHRFKTLLQHNYHNLQIFISIWYPLSPASQYTHTKVCTDLGVVCVNF